jgi:hypothetical protein
MKTRAGWKETSVHEVGGRDGGPIKTSDGSARERLEALIERIHLRTLSATSPEIGHERSP